MEPNIDNIAGSLKGDLDYHVRDEEQRDAAIRLALTQAYERGARDERRRLGWLLWKPATQ